MREWLRAHAHSASSFAAMLIVAGLLGATMGVTAHDRQLLSALPAPAIDLPPASQDRDRDTYADDVDLVEGNAHIRVAVEALDADRIVPYLVVGTQDDHWRTGAARELEWRHIIDADALGHKPGSRSWYDSVVRTGAWWYSLPMEQRGKAMAPTGDIPEAGLPGIEWPQVFHVDVREDVPEAQVRVELYDARPDPDVRVATWNIHVDIQNGTWRVGSASAEAGAAMSVPTEPATIRMRVDAHSGIPREDQVRIAQRWAPELRFDSEERFFPTAGEALQQFHGFSRAAPADANLRTWSLAFDNGRDRYVLHTVDVNGDRQVDHRDVQLMTDILRAGGVAPDTGYVHVRDTTGDRVVVQYWFIYMYNFVEDEAGDGVPVLAHRGDREFIQLTFASRQAALGGHPESIAYSQHYRGILIDQPSGELFADDTHPIVYPARGSHASYPAPGDDRRFRSALSGYGDRFDGEGEVWEAGDYALELIENQEWAHGHLWGPFTRHSRDFGTASKPLLQHAFRYPFIDPMAWQDRLRVLEEQDLERLYGSGS